MPGFTPVRNLRNRRRNTCGICGGYPVGIACYHICPNSVHYYSPERERADEASYGDDDNRERYAATIEASQYYDDEPDIPFDTEGLPEPGSPVLGADPDDDIPF